MSFEKPEEDRKDNVISIEDFRHSHEKILEAKEIMGEDFLGRREVEKALGIKIDAEKIPEIPFSKEDLERARELNQFLILRVDKTADEKRLTIENINKLLKGKLKKNQKFLANEDENGNIYYSAWYKKEDFAVKDTPKNSWALVSKELIPGSEGTKYIEQTQEIISYLKNNVFKNRTLPENIQGAIDEFETKKDKLKEIIEDCGSEGGMEKAANALTELKITKILRPTPVEVFYDACLLHQKNGEKLIKDSSMAALTSKTDSEDYFIYLVNPGTVGIDFDRISPRGASSRIGTFFSRTDT